MNRKIFQLTVVLIVLLNVLSTAYILYVTEHSLEKTTANAAGQGTVSLCFNQAPSFSIPCNSTMSQGTLFTCQLNASDPDGGTITYSQTPNAPDNQTYFNISSSGLINFTPSNDAVGNHSVTITIDDGSGCNDAEISLLYEYNISNINDAPILLESLPDQNFTVNTTLVAFFLSDYFSDPDGDELNFTFVRDLSEITMNVTLNGDSSVVFFSRDCGSAFFRFFATDPYGLQTPSNLIEVESECPEEQSGGGTSSSSSGGGGGGGGGSFFQCRPELSCLPWSDCYPNNLSVQVCRDKNGCNTDSRGNVNEIKFYQNCTYTGEKILCQEDWLCSDWSVCSMDGNQNRSCEDLERCDTTYFRPSLEQECTYLPTCHDGVQNGDETGIDCGGSCQACRVVQQPTILVEAGFPTLWVFIIILLLSVLLAVTVLYREQLHEAMARLGWLMVRKHKKELLLTQAEKQIMFESIYDLERNMREKKLGPEGSYEKVAAIVRKYYSFALDIPFEFTLEEFSKALDEAKISQELKDVFLTFVDRLTFIESSKVIHLLGPQLLAVIREEVRLLTCMTSEYTLEEVERELASREITDSLSYIEEIWIRLLNSFEALQFLRSDLAREEYMKILKAYENLTAEQKSSIYTAINRLYIEIKYCAEVEE